MTERQYNDDEVAAIFRAAAEGPGPGQPPAASGKGLTLRDLQAIAREVDIAPEAISRAAQSLDSPRAAVAAQTFAGLPIAVERMVALPRRLTDTEWEMLVAELRHVFRARGKVRALGSLREWNNGNLQAVLEPTSTGQQLRLSTVKGNARSSITTGGLIVVASAVMAVATAAQGTLAAATPGLAALSSVGAALVASGAFGLPGWARRRRQQMDGVIERLLATIQGNEVGRTLPPVQPDTAADGVGDALPHATPET